jgi:hypothetical protein
VTNFNDKIFDMQGGDWNEIKFEGISTELIKEIQNKCQENKEILNKSEL